MSIELVNRPPSPAPAEAEIAPPELELSIVMPCLNEAETLAQCIRKAQESLRQLGIAGEVIVADNGSSDGSQALARRLGARVVAVEAKGYGNALRGGINAARGQFVVMGDSDDSYDFSALEPFVQQLRQGYDLVMGNRFRGGIKPGAMPWKHRWIGNPVLTAIGRLFFRCPVGDFHCGLRAFRKQAYTAMDLQTTGMEFASEMVIKSTLLGQKITEVPTILHKDGRSRPPHLRSWRDGWRNLRFMLLFSPLWLFLIPGSLLFAAGLALSVWLIPGPRHVGPVTLDVNSLLVASLFCLLGFQLMVFAAFTKSFAVVEGLHPPSAFVRFFFRHVTLEVGVLAGLALVLLGGGALGWVIWGWSQVSFGDLNPSVSARQVIPAVVMMTLGTQTIFSSFFLSVLGLRRKD